MSVHCLIIEGEPNTARFLSKGLKEAGYVVTCCSEKEEGLQLAIRKQWDVVIVGRMLPGNEDGLSMVKTLRDLGIKPPVLMLTTLAGLDERVRELRAGGDDYLPKPFAFSELMARVEFLARRHLQVQHTEELQVADLKLNLRTRCAERAGRLIYLQPREFRLIEYLVRHQNQIVTRTMLLESVWDHKIDSNAGVLNVQISRLRSKIDKGYSTRLLHTIRGAGYMVGVHG